MRSCLDCYREFERTSNSRKRCILCATAQRRIRAAEHYASHKEEIIIKNANRNAKNYIRLSVRQHHISIFGNKKGNGTRSCYSGMLFFKDWDPARGGSFQAGADWIVENIGERPNENASLHVDHTTGLGFAPNNLS